MAKSQFSAAKTEVYERLINRLCVALDSVKTASQLRDERPVELELRGLSRAELELINAYLKQSEHGAEVGSQGGSKVQETPQVAKVIWLKDRLRRQAAKR